MLERPDIQDQWIISCVQDNYGLQVAQVTFLPIGVDVNAAVYRVVATDGTAYFLKLRKGVFAEITVAVPQFLSAQGIHVIIAPLQTLNRQLYRRAGDYTTILYPFIPGRDGYEVALSDQQWVRFGSALKAIHSVHVPDALMRFIPHEDYTPRWRDIVRTFQAQVAHTTFDDPVAIKLAASMQARADVISHIVGRTDQLGRALSSRSPQFVLCHSDVHPGNLHITDSKSSAGDGFYIVDWDAPIFAPKERDLLLIGGCSTWNSAQEEALFYQGYGPEEVDQMALAYYRYERVIQDLAVECEQVFLTSGGGEDREQAYRYFLSNFLPAHEIEIALKTDNNMPIPAGKD